MNTVNLFITIIGIGLLLQINLFFLLRQLLCFKKEIDITNAFKLSMPDTEEKQDYYRG